ncbi:MAG: DUF1826 domain-containing protein [Pseudomonadota bacterium]
MTVHQIIDRATVAAVHIDGAPKALAKIAQPGCAAAIWQRTPLPRFQRWMDGLDPASLPTARIMLRPHAVEQAMRDLMDAAAVPDCDERAMLIGDIAALSAIFSSILKTAYLRLRLDAVTPGPCGTFHTDAVTARLICTYRGSGTHYRLPGQDIHHVATGAPMILRGSLWPSGTDVLHRSPPIEGTSETRLVLMLDPVADTDAAVAPHTLH